MRALSVALFMVGAIALAQPVDPSRPTFNSVTVRGTIGVTTLDAGSGQVNGNLQVLGTEKLAVLDAGTALINGQLQVSGPVVNTVSSGGFAYRMNAGSFLDFGQDVGNKLMSWSVGASAIFTAQPFSTSSTLSSSSTGAALQLSGSGGQFKLGTPVIMQNTAPTISSGFGTSPSIVANAGTAAFEVNVGTGGTATSGVIGLPTATTGWVCVCSDITTPGANITRQTASSTTSCTVTNVAMSTGSAAAWTASDKLWCIAMAF